MVVDGEGKRPGEEGVLLGAMGVRNSLCERRGHLEDILTIVSISAHLWGDEVGNRGMNTEDAGMLI